MHAQENSKGPLTSSANPIFLLTCPLNALLYRPLVRLNGMRSNDKQCLQHLWLLTPIEATSKV